MSSAVNGNQSIGLTIRVYWEDDDEWYEGTIQKYEESSGYYVIYEDGEEQWETLPSPSMYKLMHSENDEETEQSKELNNSQDENEAIGSGESDDEKSENEKSEEEALLEGISEAKQTTNEALEYMKNVMEKESGSQNRLRNTINVRKLPLKSKAVFHRDRETLLDMKRDLEVKQRVLQQENEVILLKVQSSKQLSASLRREFESLEARNTVQSVRVLPRVQPAKVQPAEQVFELKVHIKELKKSNQQLDVQAEDSFRKLAATTKKVDKLRDQYNKIPAKDRQGIVELHMEIGILNDEKRALNKEKRVYENATGSRAAEVSGSGDLGEIQQHFEELCHDLTVTREDRDYWNRQMNQEKAKIESLHEQIHEMKDRMAILTHIA